MSEEKSGTCGAAGAQDAPSDIELRYRMSRIGRKLLVLSGKGGVGKSTVAVNLAAALARAGKSVGLLDVDLHGPSVPRILGLEGQRLEPGVSGGIVPIQVKENLVAVSVGLLLGSPADAVIWRGPMKYNVIRQFLATVSWGPLDYLVIDLPPGTGDEPLAVAQLVGDDAAAVIVTTPQEVAIADVRRSISFCEKLDVPVVGIIENMSGLICPRCGERIDLFGSGGGKRLANEMAVPFLGGIPLDPRIVLSGDQGRPFADSSDGSPAGQAFAAIVTTIINGAGAAETGPSSDTPDNQETKTMKIAIPMADGALSMHFGHCETFALVSVNPETKTITETRFLTPPPHEPGLLPRWLHEQGAEVIIAGGMGQRAQSLFAENGIKVLVGAPAEKPETLVNAYLAGTLTSGQNVCDH